MLRLSSDWLLGGIVSSALADTFRYFKLVDEKKKEKQFGEYCFSFLFTVLLFSFHLNSNVYKTKIILDITKASELQYIFQH